MHNNLIAQPIRGNDQTRFALYLHLFQAALVCTRKHPDEIQGFIDVQIVSDGSRFQHPPLQQSIPICKLHPATAEQIADLDRQHSQWEREAGGAYEDTLARLEAMVNTPIKYGMNGFLFPLLIVEVNAVSQVTPSTDMFWFKNR
jgi:hypothetical protein